MASRRMVMGVSIAALAIAVAILVITLTPQHVDRGMGGVEGVIIRAVQRVPGLGWFDYAWLERLANVVMFAPLAALVTYLVGIRRWVQVLAGCALLSAGIELTQWLFLPGRTASISDVVSNTVGAALGIAVVALATRKRWKR